MPATTNAIDAAIQMIAALRSTCLCRESLTPMDEIDIKEVVEGLKSVRHLVAPVTNARLDVMATDGGKVTTETRGR